MFKQILLLVGILVLVSGQDSMWAPAINISDLVFPTQYNVIVAVNSDQYGYTYSFREYYDEETNMWRTDGNATSSEVVEVYDLAQYTFTTFYQGAASGQCTWYNVSDMTDMLEPSVKFFTDIDINNMTFVGVETVVSRYIPTYHYTLHQIFGSDMKFDSDLFFDVTSRLPVRVIVSITVGNSTEPQYSAYYDWVDWVVGPVNPSVFATPGSCVFNANISDVPDVEWSNVTYDRNPLPPNSPFPTLSPDFHVVVEGKLNDYGSDFVIAENQIGAEWGYDSASKKERIEVVIDNFGIPNVQLYDYTAGFNYVSYPDYGICAKHAFNSANTTASFLSSNSWAPATTIDTLHKIFTPTLYNTLAGFNVANAQYVGRNLVRGVPADTWRFTGLTQGNYSFSTYVYFFPKGWQFPGRRLTTEVIPIRVLNNGTLRGSDGNFTDIFQEWDLFLYFSSPPPASTVAEPADCPLVLLAGEILKIPDTYSVFVTLAEIQTGITIAYEEITDQTQALSRIYFYKGDQFVMDLVEGFAYAYFPYESSRTCQIFAYDLIDSGESDFSFILQPTYQFPLFNPLFAIEYVYNSSTWSVRNIYADHYKLNAGYFGIDLFVDKATRYPIRFQIIFDPSFNTSDVVIDYLDWSTELPTADVFEKPTGCDLTINFTEVFDFVPTYNPTDPVNQTLPSVANQFFLVLEGKLNAENVTTGIEWYYDGVAKRERVENFVSSTGTTTFLTYEYAAGNAYTYANNACDRKSLGESSMSPLLSMRAGFIHDFFDPSFNYTAAYPNYDHTTTFKYSNGVYQGETPVRGVNAVTFKYGTIAANIGTSTFAYDAFVYFFPQNWGFPFRNMTADTRVPMRITLIGAEITESGTVQFNDTWDIFEYHPSAPQASFFSPCTGINLPTPSGTPSGSTTGNAGSTTGGSDSTTGSGSTSGSDSTTTTTTISMTTEAAHVGGGSKGLSGGAKAGIAIVVIAAVVAIVIGVYVLAKRKKPASRGDAKGFAKFGSDE